MPADTQKHFEKPGDALLRILRRERERVSGVRPAFQRDFEYGIVPQPARGLRADRARRAAGAPCRR